LLVMPLWTWSVAPPDWMDMTAIRTPAIASTNETKETPEIRRAAKFRGWRGMGGKSGGARGMGGGDMGGTGGGIGAIQHNRRSPRAEKTLGGDSSQQVTVVQPTWQAWLFAIWCVVLAVGILQLWRERSALRRLLQNARPVDNTLSQQVA